MNTKEKFNLKDNKEKRKVKIISTVIALISITIGILLVINSYLLENPINFTQQEKDQSVSLQKNPPLVLGNFQQKILKKTELPWGEDIKSSFSPYMQEKLYLKLEVNNENIIGYLEDDLFIELYRISANTEQVKIYEDESLSYIDYNNDFNDQKFTLLNKDGYKEKLVFQDTNKRIKSYIYSPEEKSFYLFSIDRDENSYIDVLDLGFELNNIYSTTILDSDYKIASYNNLTTILYLSKNNTECYQLDLSKKQIDSTKCEFVRYSKYVKNLLTQGEAVQSYNTSNGDFETYFTKDKNFKYSNFNFNNQDLTYTSSIQYSLFDLSFYKFINSSKKQSEVVDNLPEVLISNIFEIDNDSFIISNSSSPKILKYNPREAGESSLPELPGEEVELDNQSDWQELKLYSGIRSIELLNSEVKVF